MLSSVVFSAAVLFGIGAAAHLSGRDGTPQPSDPVMSSVTEDCAPRDSFYYPLRTENLPPVYTWAGQHPDSVKHEARILWDNMRRLDNDKTVMGPLLTDFSRRANIIFCREPMSGQWAEWNDSDGIVRVTSSNEKGADFLMTTQAHEIIHGIQRTTGVKTTEKTWQAREFQLRTLSIEAAARVSEYMVALEFRQAGKPGPWHEVCREYPDPAAAILADYRVGIQQGLSHREALLCAGEAAFYRQFQVQSWLDSYNVDILQNYIALSILGDLKPPVESGFSIERIKRAGYLSPQFNFTARADRLPSGLCGSNVYMEQAFTYADAERLKRTLGPESHTYLRAIEKLKRDGNPYVGIDLRLALFSGSKISGITVFEMMNFMAFGTLTPPSAPPSVVSTTPRDSILIPSYQPADQVF